MKLSERRLMRTRPFGSWLLGPEDEGADRLWLRVQVLLTTSQLIANLVGTVLVTTLLALVIPGRPVLTADLAWLNFVAVPAYVVVNDKHLRGIALARPSTPADLVACDGIGPAKLERYGDEILEVLEPFIA